MTALGLQGLISMPAWGPSPLRPLRLITSMGLLRLKEVGFTVYNLEFLDQFSKMLQSTMVDPNSSSVSLESPRYKADNVDNIAGQ